MDEKKKFQGRQKEDSTVGQKAPLKPNPTGLPDSYFTGLSAIGMTGDVRNSTWSNNTVSGEAQFGILVRSTGDFFDFGGYTHNNNFYGNKFFESAGYALTALTSHVFIQDPNSKNNTFGPGGGYGGNVFGLLDIGAEAVFICNGSHNKIVYNDFTHCNAPGWTAPNDGPGCIFLGDGTRGNFIKGNMFPAGTTMCDQIIDFDLSTGGSALAQGSQDAIPGYGICVKNADPDKAGHIQDAFANQLAHKKQYSVSPSDLGFVYDNGKHIWVDKNGKRVV